MSQCHDSYELDEGPLTEEPQTDGAPASGTQCHDTYEEVTTAPSPGRRPVLRQPALKITG